MCIIYLFLYLIGILYQCIETDSALLTKKQVSRKSLMIVAKNKEFVDDIKQELRQNNDDYLESSSLTPTLPQTREKETRIEGRRALNSGNKTSPSPSPVDLASEESSMTEERVNALDKIDTSRRTKENNRRLRLGKQSSTSTEVKRVRHRNRSTTGSRKTESATTQKYVIPKSPSVSHKRRMKKLMESLVKKGAPKFRAAEAYEHYERPAEPSPRRRPARGGGGGGGSALELSRERPPDSRQLDMAPARGGRVDRMRLKNHLCQRNVLMPEGPKYNSQGIVYLSAYSPRPGGRDYANTRPRTLVLPRCCNCCKKSVLGCE